MEIGKKYSLPLTPAHQLAYSSYTYSLYISLGHDEESLFGKHTWWSFFLLGCYSHNCLLDLPVMF